MGPVDLLDARLGSDAVKFALADASVGPINDAANPLGRATFGSGIPWLLLFDLLWSRGSVPARGVGPIAPDEAAANEDGSGAFSW